MSDLAERLYERVLVLRAQAGDEAAFTEIVERYHARLRYYMRKMLGDLHRAEDALQEVWLSVFRGLPRLAEPASFAAWLYRIARDRVFRDLRQRRPPHFALEEADLAEEVEEDFSPEDSEQIHLALDRLTPEHREVLVLRFIEDMSYEDIAGVVACPVGTVRSRLYHAKRALRGALERISHHE
jgi:RNA polymerase sigma-70 factor (ECF subfamily)